jgi:hypothetical protein
MQHEGKSAPQAWICGIARENRHCRHHSLPLVVQGCQMVCFRTKNPNLGKFWRVLQWKMLAYFMDTWSNLGLYVMDIWCSSW